MSNGIVDIRYIIVHSMIRDRSVQRHYVRMKQQAYEMSQRWSTEI